MEFIPGDNKESMEVRGLTFEMVMAAPLLDWVPSPTREGQMLLVVEIGNYAVVAPCKPLGGDKWMIVTAYKSRKYTQNYLKK